MSLESKNFLQDAEKARLTALRLKHRELLARVLSGDADARSEAEALILAAVVEAGQIMEEGAPAPGRAIDTDFAFRLVRARAFLTEAIDLVRIFGGERLG